MFKKPLHIFLSIVAVLLLTNCRLCSYSISDAHASQSQHDCCGDSKKDHNSSSDCCLKCESSSLTVEHFKLASNNSLALLDLPPVIFQIISFKALSEVAQKIVLDKAPPWEINFSDQSLAPLSSSPNAPPQNYSI